MSATELSEKVRPFDFESFGVKLRITGSSQDLIDQAATIATKALVDNMLPIKDTDHDVVFDIFATDEYPLNLKQNGELVSWETVPEHFFKYFNTLVRIAVAERAPHRVFMHAGAVAWKGKGIIFPGTSFVGKSTLVAELVRQGATYYSDDYAIFDIDGKLHPFPRVLSMRADDGLNTRYDVMPESIGHVGTDPIDVGTVVLTRYEDGALWEPELLTAGTGVMEMMQYTFSFRERPDFSLSVLNKVAESAIILSSLRGSVENFAKILLDFVDKSEV